jgi:hemerythrin-like domain-containing protein
MTTSTTTRVDTWEMVLVHRVFRREFRILPALIRAATPGDTARAEVVGSHLANVAGALHHHHEAEDELLWPVMLDRVGLRTDLVHRMEAQHERLGGLLTRIDDLTARWRAAAAADVRDELAEMLAQASVALDEHLADEERELLPLVSEHVTQAEWDALNEKGREAIPKNRLALVFIGAILEEADPRETKKFLAELPAPARLLWRLVGARTYAKSRDGVRRG